MPSYEEQLINDAQAKYPFLKRHNPVVITNPSDTGNYAETWPIGEPGDEKYPRPNRIPIHQLGVEVYRPDQFSADDLAGEVLHADPVANNTRQSLMRSWAPKQLSILRQQAGDYQATLDSGGSEADAVRNATDSAMRGYVINQWPDDANSAMNYDANQLKMLDSLRSYMTTDSEKKSKGGAIGKRIAGSSKFI